MAFRQRTVDPLEVGEKLGVQYFVSGRVRRSGRRIRLWVELIDVATASMLWVEKYDFHMNEIFDLQDEIAIKTVGQIATRVRQTEIRRALRKPPESLTAYDYFLRALDLLYRLDFASFARARTLLEKAREEDPSYAAPFAFSAHWHMFNIAEGWSSDVGADADEVIRLSNCAIERDPSNGFAFAIQGHGRAMFFRDYDAGIDFVDRATTISPSSSWAWAFSSGPYGFIGETKIAIARAERAIRLSPIDAHAFFKLILLGQNHYLDGTFEDAIRWSRKSLNLNPRFGNAARNLGRKPRRRRPGRGGAAGCRPPQADPPWLQGLRIRPALPVQGARGLIVRTASAEGRHTNMIRATPSIPSDAGFLRPPECSRC